MSRVKCVSVRTVKGYRRTASQPREALAAELRKDLARASMRLSEKEAADLRAAVRVSPTGLFSYRLKENCKHLVEILNYMVI